MKDITNEVFNNYKNNLSYLEKTDKALYDKIVLLEQAIEESLYKENFFLEYKEDSYFDLYNSSTDSYIYNQNSNEYGSILANRINHSSHDDSFKSFYEINIPNKALEGSNKLDITANYLSCTGSLIAYIKSNLPKQETLKKIHKFLFLGVGLGTHIEPTHNMINSNSYFVTEDNLEIFRLSLFVTKYWKIAERSKIKFSIADKDEVFKQKFNDFFNFGFVYNHFLKFNLFSKNSEKFVPLIQSTLTEQDHYLYPYHRPFTTIERLFDLKEESFLNVANLHENFLDSYKPVLILASGPSSKYHENWIKENQDKFIIVAIFATLSFCERNNIKPDVIVQLDEYKIATEIILKKIKSKKLFEDAIFILGSASDPEIQNEFPLNKKYYVQMNRISMHESLGKITASSVGEFTYCLLLQLGFKDIYLLGLDLALDPETNKTHADDHHASISLENEKGLEKNFSLLSSTFKIKGNFQKEVYTTTLFYTSIKLFNKMSAALKQDWQNVYNLNNGAYLEGTKATKVESLKLEKIEKDNIDKELIKSFNGISTNKIDSEDLKVLNIKLNNAYKIKSLIDDFAKIKSYGNSSFYMKELTKLISNSVQHRKMDNLSDILYNYYQFVIHYIIYFLHLKEVNNHKKHTKKINKILLEQLYRIVNTYINHFEKLLDKK